MKIQAELENFSRFLKTIGGGTLPGDVKRLYSYTFSIPTPTAESILSPLFYQSARGFYFSSPVLKTRILAVGRVYSIRGRGTNRFTTLEKARKRIEHVVHPRANGATPPPVPLFVGSMSFFPEHRHDLWAHFEPSDWFIPEFILSKGEDSYTASFQVDPSTRGDYTSRLKALLGGLSHNSPLAETFNQTAEVEEIDKRKWTRVVCDSLSAIKRGELDKVVLSRPVFIRNVDVSRVLENIFRLDASAQNSYTFVLRSGNSYFVGVSPEPLATFHDGKIFCTAVAGSTMRGDSVEADERFGKALLESTKNRNEHKFVVEHMRQVLERHCSRVQVDRVPILKKFSYIQHLYTAMEGTLREGESIVNVLEDLHPTPAVGGYPIKRALEFIRHHEGYDRGLYTGFLGWFDGMGNGDFCVGLRSALLQGNCLTAFVGSGIVSDSNPDDEFEETETKLKAITSLVYS